MASRPADNPPGQVKQAVAKVAVAAFAGRCGAVEEELGAAAAGLAAGVAAAVGTRAAFGSCDHVVALGSLKVPAYVVQTARFVVPIYRRRLRPKQPAKGCRRPDLRVPADRSTDEDQPTT